MSSESREVATVAPMSSEVVLTREKLEAFKATYAPDLTDAELTVFGEACHRTRLDPFARHIYAIKRKGRLTIQTGIDGFRSIADRTEKYAGQLGPFWCGEDGVWRDHWLTKKAPTACKIGVIRSDFREPLWAFARTDAYRVESNDLWNKMPEAMIAKCFSPDTEVLTETGFHRFDRISPNCGRIMQVTDHGLEPVHATSFAQEYSGDMVTLDSDDLNFCVTPNHDMVTTAGKIEAGVMYEQARTRPQHWIPRTLTYWREPSGVSNQQIRLAAAYIADGTDYNTGGFKIEVSRPAKIEALRAIGGYLHERVRESAGAVAYTATRTIITRSDKASFTYDFALISWLCSPIKRLDYSALRKLNREQARLFVDTLISFDGTTVAKTGVRRFYTSRGDHLAAFEMACVIAGYSVSQRKSRMSDISTTPNYSVTISDRNEIPVMRWGREYHNVGNGNAADHTGVTLTRNESGKVWCVTVPSGVIVVRRNGFSMLCGNCAEALALRKAFPNQLGGLYTEEEMEQADTPPSSQQQQQQREPRRVQRTAPTAINPMLLKERAAALGIRGEAWGRLWAERKSDLARIQDYLARLEAEQAAARESAVDEADVVDADLAELDTGLAGVP